MKPISNYTIRETLFTSSKSIIYRAMRDLGWSPRLLKVINSEFPSASSSSGSIASTA